MSRIVECSCGTKLRLQSHRKAVKVQCPSCKRSLMVKPEQPKTSASEAATSAAKIATPEPVKPNRAPVAVPASTPASDHIFVNCSCKKALKIPRKLLGKSVRCPHCGAVSKLASANKNLSPASAAKPAPAIPATQTPTAAISVQPIVAQSAPVAVPAAEGAHATADPFADPFDFPSNLNNSSGSSSMTPGAPINVAAKKPTKKLVAPDSMACRVIQWSIVGMLICSLLVVILAGCSFAIRKIVKNDISQTTRSRPSTLDESRAQRDAIKSRLETYRSMDKAVNYVEIAARTGMILASIACVLGLVISITKSSGTVLAALSVTAILLSGFVMVDGIFRTGPMFTLQTELQPSRDLPATLGNAWAISSAQSGERAGDLIWKATAIEILLGAFFVSFGISAIIRRRCLKNDPPLLSYTVAIGGSVYLLFVMVSANLMSNLDFFDKGTLPGLMVAGVFFMLPVILLLAMFVSINDSKKIASQPRRSF